MPLTSVLFSCFSPLFSFFTVFRPFVFSFSFFLLIDFHPFLHEDLVFLLSSLFLSNRPFVSVKFVSVFLCFFLLCYFPVFVFLLYFPFFSGSRLFVLSFITFACSLILRLPFFIIYNISLLSFASLSFLMF